jgi:hypothetical protein
MGYQRRPALVCPETANPGQTVPQLLLAPLQALRASLHPASRPPSVGKPRESTKQAQVLAMLHRPEGATVAQITHAMAWQPHTIHAFFDWPV